MSRPWIRLYRADLNDPRVISLSDKAFRAWINIQCCADDDGDLPRVADLALALRATERQVNDWLGVLSAHGLIEIGDDDLVTVSEWSARQRKSDTSNERVRRHRERARIAACSVTRNVTPTTDVTLQGRYSNVTCNVTVPLPSSPPSSPLLFPPHTPPITTPLHPPHHPTPPDTLRAREAEISDDCDEAFSAYLALAEQIPAWVQHRSLIPKHRRQLGAALREIGGLAGWDALLARCRDSPFLSGESASGPDRTAFRLSFDFLLRPDTIRKILDGNYDRQHGRSDAEHARTSPGERRFDAFLEAAAASCR